MLVVKHDFLSSYERRYKSLFELSPSAILLLDQNARIKEANTQAYSLFEFDKARTLVNQHFIQFVIPERKDQFLFVYRDYFGNQSVQSTSLIYTAKKIAVSLHRLKRNGDLDMGISSIPVSLQKSYSTETSSMATQPPAD
ncbi:PAS domain-containing protein [Paenibacillus mucilaginosus]|uniref:PAS domain-containing protein n=1 Tax=Paenibacillus mucilaginosus TaxID=61624 RepID=UPI001F38B883|nr:PAS domain-containing protein [Paenibacillus mucilaginosus]MCG7213328.1 PAS domain-containing protein [Paenibacillus mucilaginosus]